MAELSNAIVSILEYVVPGFIAARISCASRVPSEPSRAEDICNGLVFAVIVDGVLAVERSALETAGLSASASYWAPNAMLVARIVTAVIVGVLVCGAARLCTRARQPKPKKKADDIPKAFRGLNYNPPPDFPPPDWLLDLNRNLERKWRSSPEATEEPEHQ